MSVVNNAPIFGDLLDVEAFVEVAVNTNFSRAAQRLGEPRATVSRRIARLEHRIGTRLFERTTRRVQLTQTGELLLQHAQRILEEMAGARLSLEAMQGIPAGRIRITAPLTLGQALLGPILQQFIDCYPEIVPFVDLTNKRVNLIEDGFDVAIRLGPLPVSGMVGRRIGEVEAALYSASNQVSFSRFKEPSDLVGAPLLRMCGTDADAAVLDLTCTNGDRVSVEVRPKLVSTEPTTLLAATRSGQGIGMLPTFTGEPLVENGVLQRVLPDWAARRNDVYLVTPSARLMRPAVRAFLDFASERLERVLT